MMSIDMRITSWGLWWVLGGLAACSAAEQPQEDLNAPQITIVAPSAGARFEAGTLLTIEFDLAENQELHAYNAVLRSSDGSVALTVTDGHLHAREATITETVLLPDKPGQTYILTVKANDHNDNQAMTNVTFFTH